MEAKGMSLLHSKCAGLVSAVLLMCCSLAWSRTDKSLQHRMNEGLTLYKTGRYVKAAGVFERALENAGQSPEIVGHLSALAATCYKHTAQHQLALKHFRRATGEYRSIGNEEKVSFFLFAIGQTYVSLGEHEHALSYFNQALALERKRGNAEGVMLRLNHMGELLRKLCLYDRALDCHREALSIATKTGDGVVMAVEMGAVVHGC